LVHRRVIRPIAIASLVSFDPHGVHRVDVVRVETDSRWALSKCQLLLFLLSLRLLDLLGAGDEDTRGRLGLSVVAFPDSLETGKFRDLRADGLEVAEGGLENTAGGAGAAENLVDEASNGDEVSKLGGSAALDESRS
jgi:hypothetical protein